MTDKQMFFKGERHHRCRAALERDLAETVDDPVRKRRHRGRAAWHLRQLRRPADRYLIS